MLSLRPKWTPYIPVEPSAKQLAFLMLPHNEALFGGAAGGGKSIALLIGALQYVDIPGYAALLFRKHLTDHRQPAGLLTVAHEWLDDTPAKFTQDGAGRPTFMFPCEGGGYSTITFGYIGEFRAYERYQGGEYQYLGWDELTQQMEEDYTWMFSRLRRPGINKYPGSAIYKVPLRVRSATNPGGSGHSWVKKRFNITKDIKSGRFIGGNPKRPFIPSYIQDNPYLDQESYLLSLAELDPVVRGQMERGDWDVSEQGRFKPDNAKYYFRQGEFFNVADKVWMPGQLRYFVTVDPAASQRTGVGEVTFYKQRMASWSVMSEWAMTPRADLLLLKVTRFQREAPEIIQECKKIYMLNPAIQYFCIEQNGPGIVVLQLAARLGLPVKPIITINDKLMNSADAQNRFANGQVYLPAQESTWKREFEEELYNWTGHPYELDDQIDTLSNACKEVSLFSVTRDRIQGGLPMPLLEDRGPVVVPPLHGAFQ